MIITDGGRGMNINTRHEAALCPTVKTKLRFVSCLVFIHLSPLLVLVLCQAWSFLSHLPVLEVQMSVKGWWEDTQEQTERRLPRAGVNLRDESSWLQVHADQEYVLQVSLRRINMGQQRVSSLDTKASIHTLSVRLTGPCVSLLFSEEAGQ